MQSGVFRVALGLLLLIFHFIFFFIHTFWCSLCLFRIVLSGFVLRTEVSRHHLVQRRSMKKPESIAIFDSVPSCAVVVKSCFLIFILVCECGILCGNLGSKYSPPPAVQVLVMILSDACRSGWCSASKGMFVYRCTLGQR